MRFLTASSWPTFLDNESIGGSVGAFIAFFLFFLTHTIIGFFKNRRIHKKLIPALLVIAQDLCERKILTVTRLLAGSRSKPPSFTSAPIMPFQVAELEALQCECLWHFGNIEKRAFNAICFHMKEADVILRSAQARVEKWRDGKRQQADIDAMLVPLEEDLADVERQPRAIEGWLKDFDKGHFDKIMNSHQLVPATVARPLPAAAPPNP
jgi:hypothetical protein